jgi:hypothetical protein
MDSIKMDLSEIGLSVVDWICLAPVALVKTDVSEERIASIIRVERISELGTLAVTMKRRFLQKPHGVTSQKTAFIKVTAVKSSNLT